MRHDWKNTSSTSNPSATDWLTSFLDGFLVVLRKVTVFRDNNRCLWRWAVRQGHSEVTQRSQLTTTRTRPRLVTYRIGRTCHGSVSCGQRVERAGLNRRPPQAARRRPPAQLRVLNYLRRTGCDDDLSTNERRIVKNKAVVDSNFAHGAATWRTRRNITSSLTLPHWRHYVRTWRHPQNRGSTKRIVLSLNDDRATATVNTYTENLLKFRHVFFEICERTDRQADTQTRWSQYFAPLPYRGRSND